MTKQEQEFFAAVERSTAFQEVTTQVNAEIEAWNRKGKKMPESYKNFLGELRINYAILADKTIYNLFAELVWAALKERELTREEAGI